MTSTWGAASEGYLSVSASTEERPMGVSGRQSRVEGTQDMQLPLRRLTAQARTPALHPSDALSTHLQGMDKWQGRVVEVDHEMFSAELTSATDGPSLLADFEVDVVPQADLELLAVGAVFYLTVRTVGESGRRRTRTSSLRFQRLGLWTQEEVEAIRRNAKEDARELDQYVD